MLESAPNQVWRGPENLLSGAEIDDPGAWIDRVGVKRERRFLALFR